MYLEYFPFTPDDAKTHFTRNDRGRRRQVIGLYNIYLPILRSMGFIICSFRMGFVFPLSTLTRSASIIIDIVIFYFS